MLTDRNQQWYFLAIALLVGYLVYLLSPILTPFAVGALLAYLFDPLADKLESWKLSRSVAVTLVFFVIEASTTANLVMSTKVVSILNLGVKFFRKAYVPP